MKGKPKARALATAPSLPVDAKPYEPTSHERAAAQRLLDQRKNRAPAPKYKVTVGNGRTAIEPDHAEPAAAFALLANAFSTSDAYFAEGLLYQLANVSRTGKDITTRELNTMIATVHAVGPRDPTEALLAVQMAAIHQATMVAARRLNHVDTIDQQDSASNMFNKLARTFAAQIEALKRYRTSGEQNVKVTHQHVSVNANQAVVGINQGGGGAHENASQSHAPRESAPYERGPALFSQEQAQPMPLPSAGSEGQEGLPLPRSESGRAEGEGQRCMAARARDQ
jgi:hypothetical protein